VSFKRVDEEERRKKERAVLYDREGGRGWW